MILYYFDTPPPHYDSSPDAVASFLSILVFGTRIEEVSSMQVARRAGLPVPRVICYDDHFDTPHAPVSILMTRVPGEELGRVNGTFSEEENNSIREELKGYLETIRAWSSPWGKQRICSLQGTSISSVRVPNQFAGPFESELDLNEYLIQPTWSDGSRRIRHTTMRSIAPNR